MPFIQLDNIDGEIYVPEEQLDKKNNCKDCFSCQMCSDSRCELCLKKCKNVKNV